MQLRNPADRTPRNATRGGHLDRERPHHRSLRPIATQIETHTASAERRRTLATLIDDRGLSARVGADHLGHSKVSMTQDVYMARGKTHTQVADLLDDAISGA